VERAIGGGSSAALDSEADRDSRLLRAGLEKRNSAGAVSSLNSGGPVKSLIPMIPMTEESLRLQLVATQYWERGVRSRKHPILCTDGIKRWFQTCFFKAGCCRGQSAYDGFQIEEPSAVEPLTDEEPITKKESIIGG